MADLVITTVQDLVDLSEGVYGHGTSSAYLEVELGNDIDFADYTPNYNWGGCTGTWYINFDGKGHKIDNVYYTGSAAWYFFNTLADLSTVKNVTLSNIYIMTSGTVATFNAVNNDIENVHVSGVYQATNSTVTGMIYSINNSRCEVRNCGFSGRLLASSEVAGLNYTGRYGSLHNCYVIADFVGSAIHGFSRAGRTVTNSFVRGTFSTTGNANLFGSSVTATTCYGAISASNQNISASGNNCYYDSTLATAGNFTVSGITGASTTDLKSKQWLLDHYFAA